MLLASTGLFTMNSTWENNFLNAIKYFLKGKMYNNPGPDMLLLLANHSASWKG